MKELVDFQTLIEMCEKVGWDNGIDGLERVIMDNERQKKLLIDESREREKQAQELSLKIVEQTLKVDLLKQYRREHGF